MRVSLGRLALERQHAHSLDPRDTLGYDHFRDLMIPGGPHGMTNSRIDTLVQMLAQDPSDRTLHYMLGNEYFKAQKYSQTVEVLRRYLQSGDDEGSAYRLLAKSHERLGETEEARKVYREGIVVAERHGHQPMVDEFTEALRDLE
jgi:uncharacterized protein HemY